jgi:hypothetical protein
MEEANRGVLEILVDFELLLQNLLLLVCFDVLLELTLKTDCLF